MSNYANNLTVTGYPLNAALVTPSDTTDLANAGIVRADEAGAVTVLPYGGGAAVTYNLAAGEAVPCLVRRVLDTGTDAITLHVHY